MKFSSYIRDFFIEINDGGELSSHSRQSLPLV